MQSIKKTSIGRQLFDGKTIEYVLQKLELIFSMGGTDAEAAFYAGISLSALYSYQKEHPEFLERKQALKSSPVLKARMTIVKSLESDPKVAMWYLSKKCPQEFGAFEPQSPPQEPRPRFKPSPQFIASIRKFNPSYNPEPDETYECATPEAIAVINERFGLDRHGGT